MLNVCVWFPVVVAFSMAAAACTKDNPRSCADGTCSDPAFPFCDADGAFGGVPDACIAVSCTPQAFEACRGDQAISCSGDGTDYDLLQCQLGCDVAAGGCRECTSVEQCSNPAPVCDEGTSHCRACRRDDECPSLVCAQESGACVPESDVVYASQTGIGQCSRSSPCSLSRAVMVATTSFPSPIVRLLPETFTSSLRVGQSQTVNIVATGASIIPADASPAMEVTDGGAVTIRGVRLTQITPISCKSTVSARSTVSLRDAALFVLGNTVALDLSRCSLVLSNTDIEMNGSEIVAGMADDTTLHGDRLNIHGSTSHYIFASGSRMELQLTNSRLVDVGFALHSTDTAAPGTVFTLAQDTLAFSLQSSLGCDTTPSAFLKVRYENAIIASLGPFDPVTGTNCSFTNTLLSRQSSPPSGTLVGDPEFVDPTMRDYHLKATSAAIDAAVPSLYGLDASVDLDGTSRPQGVMPDLGAYERVP